MRRVQHPRRARRQRLRRPVSVHCIQQRGGLHDHLANRVKHEPIGASPSRGGVRDRGEAAADEAAAIDVAGDRAKIDPRQRRDVVAASLNHQARDRRRACRRRESHEVVDGGRGRRLGGFRPGLDPVFVRQLSDTRDWFARRDGGDVVESLPEEVRVEDAQERFRLAGERRRLSRRARGPRPRRSRGFGPVRLEVILGVRIRVDRRLR